MAIRFMDSFSHYDAAHLFAKWTTAVNNLGQRNIIVGGGRCLQNALQLVQTQVGICQGPVWHPPFVSLTQGVMGAGMKVTQANVGNPHVIFSLMNGGALESNRVFSALLWSDGTLGMATGYFGVGGGFTEVARSAVAIQDDSWHYYEWTFTTSTSAGSGALYLDGNSTPIVTFSGNTGASAYNNIQLGAVNIGDGAGARSLTFSDFYFGDQMSDRKGDSRVYARLPIRDGSILQWTPKTGLTHFLMVDENPPDDGTTYNQTLGVGNIDLYGFPAIGIPSGTVFAVQTLPMMAKSDTGFRSAATVIRQSGTNYTGDTKVIADGSYLYYPQVYELDPTGAAWSVSTAVNNEFGVILTG